MPEPKAAPEPQGRQWYCLSGGCVCDVRWEAEGPVFLFPAIGFAAENAVHSFVPAPYAQGPLQFAEVGPGP